METVYKNCPKSKTILDNAFWIDLRTTVQNIPRGVMKFISHDHKLGLICKNHENIYTFMQEQTYDSYTWTGTWGAMNQARWAQLDELMLQIHESSNSGKT